MTDTSAALLALGDQRFVSLTTFRRNGEPVPTTVWVARDGNALVAFTPVKAGKLKRLRHTSRVEVVESSRRGKVDDAARPVVGQAQVDTSASGLAHVSGILRRKYGIEYRLVMLVERLFSKGSRDRHVIRITGV